MANISLITTVLNEEHTIAEFIESVSKQSQRPDEFVIVDGGSTDNTASIIESHAQKYPWIRLIVSKGAKIGEGRNIAVKSARSEIIACTDAGCVLDKNWLKEITAPLVQGTSDVVCGIYQPLAKNDFERAQGLLVVSKDIYLNTSRMSSRSLAFTKYAWAAAGGYPEDCKTGEDTLFNINLISGGLNFSYAPKAVVYWRMRPTWNAFAKQFRNYGAGDRKTGNIFRLVPNSIYIFTAPFSIYFAAFYDFVKTAVKDKDVSPLQILCLAFVKRMAYLWGVLMGK
jgi:glycosyltransferase involved in cell wall biosynthesis